MHLHPLSLQVQRVREDVSIVHDASIHPHHPDDKPEQIPVARTG
jgi:hypothetical protein